MKNQFRNAVESRMKAEAVAKKKRHFADFTSTVMGYCVAIAEAWICIDWKNFEIKTEWPKLALAAFIALGGHMTSINALRKNADSKS